MFTGIIEKLGHIVSFSNHRLVVEADFSHDDIAPGDSIAINGVCQTVTEITGRTVAFHVLDETRNVTNFREFRAGDAVNIELAMRVGDRLGGHIVQGHVDCTSQIIEISREEDDTQVTLQRPPAETFPIIHRGSIAINGISLTVARLTQDSFSVRIIPATWTHTNLQFARRGTLVNLEADVIGKYAQQLLAPYSSPSNVTMDMLRNAGF